MKYLSSTPNVIGGQPAIKGTRIGIAVAFAKLAAGQTIEEMLHAWSWIPEKTFGVQLTKPSLCSMTSTLMPKTFTKHKILLDENMYSRQSFPMLNHDFDVQHIARDLHNDGM